MPRVRNREPALLFASLRGLWNGPPHSSKLRVEMARVETRVRCGLSGVGALHRVASPPEKRFMTLRKHRGFSLLELLITIAIGLTMAGVTFLAMYPLVKQNHVDAAHDT